MLSLPWSRARAVRRPALSRAGRRALLLGAPAALAAAAAGWWALRRPPRPLSPAATAALYARPLAPPEGPLRVFHLGHSLVGRTMPAMLEQLAPPGHRHDSQLGWGTSLKQHWEPGATIAGFEVENAHPRFRPAAEALASGGYDAVVLTEMVEIREAIRWHASADYLCRWARAARAANPAARVYLYETWHRLDDPEGWLERIDRDLARHWEGEVLRPALVRLDPEAPIHVIPAGQALARFVRAVEAMGGVPGIADRRDLFALAADGSRDTIHLNDLGSYLVALVHFAVLYHRDPAGLPHALLRADGTPAVAPSPEAAALMQAVVAETVRGYPKTGVAPAAMARTTRNGDRA